MNSYENRIVCFLDILGFREHINNTTNSTDSSNSKQIENIFNALMIVRDVLDIDKSTVRKSEIVTQFSDCIVISFNVDEESGVFWQLLQIQWVLINLIDCGFLCRGGISIGDLIHTEKVVFGPALVSAYQMECEKAVFPRVILSKDIIEAGCTHTSHHDSETEKKYIHDCVTKDDDGYYYVDFLEKVKGEFDDPNYDYLEHLNKLSELIKIGLKTKSARVKEKYNWLKTKYNAAVEPYHHPDTQFPDSDIKYAYRSLPLFSTNTK